MPSIPKARVLRHWQAGGALAYATTGCFILVFLAS